ncbi:cupin domain-containing protein [Aurantiacibacter gangjinensis]|uniref:Uncharacterized protein n=1 Tax=Aurantiacibacter gangjinensis TaxID=502682 RepID=A0A0G9MM21_9SPHN|nr:cupin domain-containing protein [Aurantiacibacter gangjinensis]APE27625.1 putative membrane associated protein [Aurantiacibacter gangjinensis]KLE31654.1 hypothetical protein AAW01_08980 [Aurantiacibacter gangjinensis]
MKPLAYAAFSGLMIALPSAALAETCPADQSRADVVLEGPSESTDVEVVNGPAVDLAQVTGEEGVLQYRRVTIAPGGTLELHAHGDMPGFAHVLTGVAMEFRSDCSMPIMRTAGDIATEPHTLTHWWANEGETPVVLIVSHVVMGDHD